MLQTAHIINIVNIFDKEYSTAQIYWVLPYQVIMIRIGSMNLNTNGRLTLFRIEIQIQAQNTNSNLNPNTNTESSVQILYEQGEESKADEERHMIEMSSILEKFSRCHHHQSSSSVSSSIIIVIIVIIVTFHPSSHHHDKHIYSGMALFHGTRSLKPLTR